MEVDAGVAGDAARARTAESGTAESGTAEARTTASRTTASRAAASRNDVGRQLREARQAAGLGLKQVSAATNIPERVLSDLESGRTASSGGAVYVRGHVRAIAKVLGIDPGPLVAHLDALPEDTDDPAPVALVVPVPVSPGLAQKLAREAPRRTSRWQPAVVGLLGVLVVLLAIGLLRQPSSSPTLTTSTVPTPAPPDADPVPASPVPAPAAGAALAIQVRGGTSWINVTAAGRTVFEGTVDDGYTQAFTDPAAVKVRVGNAGAVDLTCGGQALARGRPGAVVTVLCGPEGVVPG